MLLFVRQATYLRGPRTGAVMCSMATKAQGRRVFVGYAQRCGPVNSHDLEGHNEP